MLVVVEEVEQPTMVVLNLLVLLVLEVSAMVHRLKHITHHLTRLITQTVLQAQLLLNIMDHKDKKWN
jgi:tetrahydromethanopterin S-methyltransferase subunit E